MFFSLLNPNFFFFKSNKEKLLQDAVAWEFRFVSQWINLHDNFRRNQCMCSALEVCHLLWHKAKDFLITQCLCMIVTPLD